MVSKRAVIDRIPTGYDNRISSTDIAERIDAARPDDDDDETKSTNVRDTIQQLRKEGFPIGGGQGLGGYWLIQDDEELELVIENIDSSIESKQETKETILEAYGTPPVGHEPVEEAPEPDVPPELRDAVDAMVDVRGVEGAERELQRRVRHHDDQQRALAALSYLRTHYRVNSGQEVIAGP